MIKNKYLYALWLTVDFLLAILEKVEMKYLLYIALKVTIVLFACLFLWFSICYI